MDKGKELSDTPAARGRHGTGKDAEVLVIATKPFKCKKRSFFDMSKFNLLSAAVVVAVAAAAAPAQAYTITTSAPNVAYVDIADASTTVTTAPLNVTLTGSDLIIGRTVGFSVKITLQNGAKFNTAFTTPGATGAAAASWTPSVAAGGTAGEDYVIILFTPAAAPTPVTTGNLFATGLTFDLKSVGALGSSGNSVSADIMFADPGTAAPIMSPSQQAVILKSVNPLAYSVDLSTVNDDKEIDVGTDNGASKTTFAADGEINSQSPEQFFEAGILDIGVVANVVNKSGLPFAWAATDLVDLTLSGNFSAFTAANGGRVVLTDTCNASADPIENAGTPVAGAEGVVGATSVTFSSIPATLADGASLCFIAPDVTEEVVIEATEIATSAKVSRGAKSTTGSDAALPMVYNGPVAYVYAFNPGNNASQVSYLRITNPSTTAGNATIERICDKGARASTSLTVPAGHTVNVLAKELEEGGANVATGYGACGPQEKSRLVITGEFLDMKVQNFLRNTGTTINTNVNNQD